MSAVPPFSNPFRPGAGHMPPYLAGRLEEKREFSRLLDQDVILQNLLLTGLRGVGKTVLLETFKPLAIGGRWIWVGTDLSESTSISERSLATRLLTDIAVITSQIQLQGEPQSLGGIRSRVEPTTQKMDFTYLTAVYEQTPGLHSDKLKTVLEFVWNVLRGLDVRGVVFAYEGSCVTVNQVRGELHASPQGRFKATRNQAA